MNAERAALIRVSRVVFLILAAWALAAVAVVSSGVLGNVPRPALQMTIGVLALAAVTVTLSVPDLRRWLRRSDPRWLVGFHLVRFIGVSFLWLTSHDRLPGAFTAAGWGDIAVAAWALALLATGLGRSKGVLLAWNIVGLADIVLVVAAAARAGMRSPESVIELTRLPLGLLPTFIVPVIIASHVLLFVRLAAAPERAAGARPIRLEAA